MQRYTFELMLLVVGFVDCWAAPLVFESTSNSGNEAATFIMGETTVSANLHPAPHPGAAGSVAPAKREHGNARTSANEVAKGVQSADADLNKDHALLPDTPTDHTVDDTEDATNEPQQGQLLKPQAIVRPYPAAGVSPIYITIPIYLSTVAGLPITLQVGGHKVPLTPHKRNNVESEAEDPSPTSQFNRLL